MSRNKGEKIVIVANRLETFGGGERWVCEAVSRLKNHFDFNIINPVSDTDMIREGRKSLMRRYNLGGVEITDIECRGKNSKIPATGDFKMLIPSLSGLNRLRESIRKSDVVYQISFNPMLLFYSLLFSRIYKKRFILGLHNPDFLRTELEKELSLGVGISKAMQRNLLNSVREVHVQTESQKELLKAAGYRGKIYYIPHFLYLEPKGSDVGVNGREFVALFAGRLVTHQKGIDLLEAILDKVVEKNKGIKIRLIGSGEDGGKLAKRIAGKHPKQVKWLGFVSEKKLREEYKKASLFILPSRYETPGLSLLEAQSYGIPAVAFDVMGPRDIIKEEFQGKLITPFDKEKFAEEVLRYYSDYKKDRKAYGVLKTKIYKEIEMRYKVGSFLRDFEQMIRSD